MRYDFKCEECGEVWEVEMSPDEFKKAKETGIPCPKTDCDGVGYFQFNPGNVQVCWSGFDWADKNFKEKSYRKDRSKVMATRQKKNNITPTLAPNYKGQRTKNWKEAREAAKADGKMDFTYDRKVAEEEKKGR